MWLEDENKEMSYLLKDGDKKTTTPRGREGGEVVSGVRQVFVRQ